MSSPLSATSALRHAGDSQAFVQPLALREIDRICADDLGPQPVDGETGRQAQADLGSLRRLGQQACVYQCGSQNEVRERPLGIELDRLAQSADAADRPPNAEIRAADEIAPLKKQRIA